MTLDATRERRDEVVAGRAPRASSARRCGSGWRRGSRGGPAGPARAGDATEFRWDPDAGRIDGNAFDGVDVVVNLAGVNLFTWPWTTAPARADPRLPGRSTDRTLATVLARRAVQQGRPPVLHGPELASATTAALATGSASPRTPRRPGLRRPRSGAVGGRDQAGGRRRRTGGDPAHRPVMDSSGSAFPLMRLAWSAGARGDPRRRRPADAVISLEDYLARRALGWPTTPRPPARTT